MLFGCIYLPNFSMQAALRGHAVPFVSTPIAVLDGPGPHRKVVACNLPARLAGVAIGMSDTEAEACSSIVLCHRSVEREEAAQAALLECSQRFSPRIPANAPGMVILDLT